MSTLHAFATLPPDWTPRDDRPPPRRSADARRDDADTSSTKVTPAITSGCSCLPSGIVASRAWTPIDDSASARGRCVSAFEWTPPAPRATPGRPARPARPVAPPRLPLEPECQLFPTSNTATNNRFLFLREIGGGDCLRPFLENIISLGEDNKFWGGTLIIDQEVVLSDQLVIPDGFTLAGVGINGGGRLRFKSSGKGQSAIKFDEKGTRGGAIRDLVIEGPGVPNFINGVKLGLTARDDTNPNPPGGYLLHRVRVAGFGGYGIQGGFHAFGVNIDGCQIIGNLDGIQLIRGCDAWRIRDCMIEISGDRGIEVGHTEQGHPGAVKGTMISGCKLRGNKNSGIRIHGWKISADAIVGTCIFGNRFEANAGKAIEILTANSATRIIGNFFVGAETLVLAGEAMNAAPELLGTHLGFNMAKTPDPDLDLNELKVPQG